MLPNTPLVNLNVPLTPRPEPILAEPETPNPPTTWRAPEVEDVELAFAKILINESE